MLYCLQLFRPFQGPKRTPRVAAFFTLLLLTLMAVPLQAEIEKLPSRTIECPLVELTVEAPIGWQVLLNERLERKAFINIQATNGDGGLIPANLNIINRRPPEGEKLSESLDAETFKARWTEQMKQGGAEITVLSVKEVDFKGYHGVYLEFSQQVGEVEVRGAQYNLVAPDLEQGFVISYGTLVDLWDDDLPYLKHILDSIQFTREFEQEKVN